MLYVVLISGPVVIAFNVIYLTEVYAALCATS